MKASWFALPAIALTAWCAAHTAHAGPTCQVITYYADASLTKVVGTWSNCPGRKGLQGRRTKFREVETEALPKPPKPPGTLPCEFQKDCETNLPTPTVVDPPKPPASGASGAH